MASTLFPDTYVDMLPARCLRHANRIATFVGRRKLRPSVRYNPQTDRLSIHDLPRGQALRLWELTRRDPRMYAFNREVGDALGVDWDNLPDETMTDRIRRFLHETEGRR